MKKALKLLLAKCGFGKKEAPVAVAAPAAAPLIKYRAEPEARIPDGWRAKLKILFLDFDGVLNAYGKDTDEVPLWASLSWAFKAWVDGDKVRRLRPLLADPDFKIVIASAWRSEWTKDQLARILNDYVPGLGDRIIDVTPYRGGRGKDIKAWLDFNDFKGPYAILDDDRTDQWLHGDKYVATNPRVGVCDRHIKRVKVLLGYPVKHEAHAKADAEAEALFAA